MRWGATKAGGALGLKSQRVPTLFVSQCLGQDVGRLLLTPVGKKIHCTGRGGVHSPHLGMELLALSGAKLGLEGWAQRREELILYLCDVPRAVDPHASLEREGPKVGLEYRFVTHLLRIVAAF